MPDDLLVTVEKATKHHATSAMRPLMHESGVCGLCDAIGSEDVELLADWLRWLVAEVERLRELLRPVEWGGWDETYATQFCHWCNNVKSMGHVENCPWKAALEEKP